MKHVIILFFGLVCVMALLADARRVPRKQRKPKPLLNCGNIQHSSICTDGRRGFSFFNGCTKCECGEEVGSTVCSPAPPCPLAVAVNETNLCKKLLRKIHRLARRARQWPVQCLRASKVCRKHPGASFFDGCRQCQCQGGTSHEAACTRRNSCAFFGTRKQYKRFCSERKRVTQALQGQ